MRGDSRKEAPRRVANIRCQGWLGKCLESQQKYADAKTVLYISTKRSPKLPPDKRADLGVHSTNTLQAFGPTLHDWGKPEEAQKWQTLLDEAGGGRQEAGGKTQPAPGVRRRKAAASLETMHRSNAWFLHLSSEVPRYLQKHRPRLNN